MKTSMRYLAVIFAVAMILCSLSSVSAAFPDVASDNKYIAAIETMTNLSIIGGYEDGTFRPDDLVRRDEMAKIIFVTYTTYTDAGEGTLTFPDVAKNSWAKGYISWCAGKKIVGGYEDGTFRPAGNITYDEALKMVCAMLGYTDFDPEQWPIDVRTKGLIDLELGKNLEGIAGDAALTRAQIVQLVFNSLDKPMYQAPKEEKDMNYVDKIFENMGVTVVIDKSTLKDNVWNIETSEAQVIATENYGLRDYEKGIVGTKTGKEDEIVVRFNKADGTFENKRIKLSDVALDAYIGNSDALIALNINIISEKGSEDEYISAELKGIVKESISGGYASADGVEYFTDSGNKYAVRGIKIDGINYYDDHFTSLRRLTYYDDFVLVTNGHVGHGSTNVINEFKLSYSWDHHNRWKSNFTFGLTQGFNKIQKGIDANGDGWVDYIILEFAELFRVKKATSKTVELEYLHKDSNANWVPVPALDLAAFKMGDEAYYKGYEEQFADGIIPALDLSFPTENVTVMSKLEEGMIVLGYQLGNSFTITAETTPVTGYITKYNSSEKKYTLDSGKTVGGDFCSWKVWDSHSYAGAMFNKFNSSMDPLIGINANGEFNYGKFWTIDDKIVWAEKVSADVAGGSKATYNKAILLYVTEATEPQVNEESKEYEVFYPAYLLIDGRTQLVNLNPTYAINKFSGESVSADGSKYRASVIDDNGKQRIINANLLVTYTIDSDGYYTLHTDSETLKDAETNEVIELVIPEGRNTISLNKSTGLFTITAADGTVYKKVMKDDNSVIYYPGFKPDTTGAHEHMEYYKGSEIPTEFGTTPVRSSIYLTYDSEKGIYYIGAMIIANEEFTDATGGKNDYSNDARFHLYAVRDTEAAVEGSSVFAAYTFKNLVTYETVEDVNSKVAYENATKAVMHGIYAWDAKAKNYVEINSTSSSAYKGNETITDYFTEEQIIFTTYFTDGVVVDETVKIIAVTDKEAGETKEITFSELLDVYETIKQYNEDNGTSKTLTAKIGTYTDENKDECLAYIVIDWVEYDEENEELVIAGETK